MCLQRAVSTDRIVILRCRVLDVMRDAFEIPVFTCHRLLWECGESPEHRTMPDHNDNVSRPYNPSALA